ncbi:MFS transporter [Sulfobacillus thermosulfidooxidans]|uniref:MFS transporter n=1 Tax=Sulfobacillus thermosulfidooxidans TaxID=28034 RepID=UPI0009F93D63
MPIWLLYYAKKGMSLGNMGLLDAVGFVAMALVDVPTGALADKFGRKYLLAAGAFFYALGMIAITSWVFSVWFFLGFALWNISNPMFNGANTALLYESLDEPHEAESFQKILEEPTS